MANSMLTTHQLSVDADTLYHPGDLIQNCPLTADINCIISYHLDINVPEVVTGYVAIDLCIDDVILNTICQIVAGPGPMVFTGTVGYRTAKACTFTIKVSTVSDTVQLQRLGGNYTPITTNIITV